MHKDISVGEFRAASKVTIDHIRIIQDGALEDSNICWMASEDIYS